MSKIVRRIEGKLTSTGGDVCPVELAVTIPSFTETPVSRTKRWKESRNN